MYSQCPDCQTRFRVTAAALRAAHGTVRCGRCGNAFDALARLSDTVPDAPAAPGHATLGGSGETPHANGQRAPAAEYHFSADDLEKVFVDARDWQRQYGGEAADAPGQPAAGGEPSTVVVDETQSLEDITLEGERIQIDVPPGFDDEDYDELLDSPAAAVEPDLDSTDRFAVLDSVPDSAYVDDDSDEIDGLVDAIMAEEAAEPAVVEPVVAEPVVVAPPVAEPARPAASVTSIESIAPRRWRAPDHAGQPEAIVPERPDSDEEDYEHAPRRITLAWTLGSLLLALTLLAQLAHHYRQDLVRHPQIGPTLAALYERLGLPLTPDWDPRAFELRQWGNNGIKPAAGRLHVQASIINRAGFAQPFPLLRLEVDDRFGTAVATRDFEPREYLKNPAVAARMLAPGASAEADLQLVDPGPDGVGYRLDLCLRESAKLLRCAEGPD